MADEHPSRYGLRSSPLKSLPPTPPRIRPSSPKKFTSPQCQIQRTLFKSRDESIDRLTTFSTRKLSSETLSGTSSSNIFGSSQSISTTSSCAIGGRSLRENGRYYSIPSACYIARSRSSTSLSEVPFGEKQRSTLVSTIDIPVHQPPPIPPRIIRANSTPDESIGCHSTGAPSRGLTRSLATARLLPAAKEELEEVAFDHVKNTEEQKREAVQGKSRRLLSHSISVACLKQESYQVPSRPAIRIRPASPSRIAKSNSGLLRSYSSVDIGGSSVASKIDNSVINRGESILPQSSQNKPERAIARIVSATTIFPSKQESICAEHTLREVSSCIPTGKLNSDTQIVLPSRLHERTYLPLKTTATSLPLINQDKAEPGSIIEKGINDAILHPPTVTASLKRHHLPSGMDNDHVHGLLKSPVKLKMSTVLSTPTSAMPSASFFLRDDVVTTEATTNLNRTESGMSSGASEKTPKPARRPKKMRRLEMENDEVDEEAREYAFESSQSTSWPRARNSPCKVMATSRVDYATRTVRSIQMEKMEEEPKKDDSVNCFPIAQAKLQDAPSKSALRLGNPSKISRNVQFAHVDVYLFERAQGFFSVPTTGEICLGMESRHFDKEYHRLDGREDEVEDDERVSKGEIQPFASHVRLPALSSPRRLPLPGEKQTTRVIEALPAKQRSQLLKTNGVKISRDSLLPQENDSIRKSRRECGCSCVGGRCLPETCECSKDGIPCQVDSEDEQFPCNCRSDSCKNVEGRIEFNHMYVYQHWKSTVARLKVWERLGDDSLGSPSHIRFPDEDDDAPKYNATSYLATPPPLLYQPSTAASTSDIPARSVFTASLEPMCTPPMLQHRTNEGIGYDERAPGDGSDRSHRRFPVTPVYKKYAIGGEKASRELSLARTAMFKAATTADNALSPTNDTTSCNDDLNESMDTSVYATPPESNTPIAAPLSSVDVVPDSSCLSPRKFPAVRSLL